MAEALYNGNASVQNPMGIVIRVNGKVAVLYVFPSKKFGTKEIKIDFTNKDQLKVGMWVYLRVKNGEENGYLFKIPKMSDPCPMKATVNPHGEVELRGRILLRKGAFGCEAWSPDLGKVGAMMERSFDPGLYDVSLKRYIRKETRSQKLIDDLYGTFDFAVIPEREITLILLITPCNKSLQLEESLLQSTGVVTEGDAKQYTIWSSPICRAAIAPKNTFLKIGDWVTFSCRLPEYGESPLIADYRKIVPLVPTEYREGKLYVEVGGYEEMLAKDIKNCLMEKIDGETQWAVWAGTKWESISEPPSNCENGKIAAFLKYSSNRSSTTQRFKKAPQYFGRDNTEEFVGVVIRDSARTGSQLFVCPLKGEPVIALKYPWYCDNVPIAEGDWVKVTAALNADAAYVSEVPPYLLEGQLLPTKMGSSGKIEIQTEISGVWRTDFDVFAYADKLGKVKDIYESVPRDCDGDDVFSVWCYPLIKPSNNCYWALVKGEAVIPIKKKLVEIDNTLEFLQQHDRSKQDSEGYYSDEIFEDETNRSFNMNSDCTVKDTRVEASDFLNSIKHVISDEQVRNVVCGTDVNLWVDILKNIAF